MGTVDIDDAGKLKITLRSPADRVALQTALRCAVDADPVTIPEGDGEVTMDSGYAEHFLVARACGFTWTDRALSRAVDELIPYARQSIAMHSTMRLKSSQRWMNKISDARRKDPAPGSDTGAPGPHDPARRDEGA